MRDWIKNLKAGDQVIVRSRYEARIAKVDKVTPTGRIKIGTTYFDRYGCEMGASTWVCRDNLDEATPEALEAIERKVIIQKAIRSAHNIQSLTYDQAIKILEVLGGDAE